MKAEIKIEGKWIRVDLKNCARPGNAYHRARGCGGFATDIGIAVDHVMFHNGVRIEEFTISPAYQWALSRCVQSPVK